MADQGLRVKRYIQMSSPNGQMREQEVDVIEIKQSDLEIIKMFWDVSMLNVGDFIIQYDDESVQTVTADVLKKHFKPKPL